MNTPDTPDPKSMAKRLRHDLAEAGNPITQATALEIVAHQWGDRDWNTLAARADASRRPRPDDLVEVIPVLRIFGGDRAFAFYTDYLGFQWDWPETFGDHEPIYAQVSRGGAKLHLSEHHGDASPGAAVVLISPDVNALEAQLRRHPSTVHPVVETADWGLSLTVQDPFNNRLTFLQATTSGRRIEEAASPIRHSLELPCDTDIAFEMFAPRMGEWWRSHSAFGDQLGGVEIEPRVGGAVRFVSVTDERSQWGTVLAWEPGAYYAQTFTLAHDPDFPSEISARFTRTPEGCRLDFEHGGWTPGNASRRNHFGDWPQLLAGYADLVARQTR